MSYVNRFEVLLALIAAVVALEFWAKKVHLPRATALIAGGIVIALLPGAPAIEIDPDLVLVVFLPPLLMSSAYFIAWRDFRADLRLILNLAVGAVVFTTLVVGAVTHWLLPWMPWAACFALGAIVSPPDAVAAKAVLKGVPLPPRLSLLLEGESLVNDASGLTLLRIATAATATGAFHLGDATLQFAVVSFGGIVMGVICAYVSSFVIRRIRDPDLALVTSFLTAWASYIAADRIGLSGVLSTVTCGIIIGWRQHVDLTAAMRTRMSAAWSAIVFVLESLIFILIGLSLRGVLDRLGNDWTAMLHLLPPVAAITSAVILSRFLWIFPLSYLRRWLMPSVRRRVPAPPVAYPFIMSWAGMRGVVSLAAALSLPEGFPGRDIIIVTAFVVILATVLIQGATLAPIARRLLRKKPGAVSTSRMDEDSARAVVADAQLKAATAQSLGPDGNHRHPRLYEQYVYRARATVHFSRDSDALHPRRVEHFSVILAANRAGRSELLRLHRGGQIDDAVLHAIEEELDLEEIRISRWASD